MTHLFPFRKAVGGLPGCCPSRLPSAMASAPKWNHPSPNMGAAVATASFSHTGPAQSPPLVPRNSGPHQLHLWLPGSHWPL